MPSNPWHHNDPVSREDYLHHQLSEIFKLWHRRRPSAALSRTAEEPATMDDGAGPDEIAGWLKQHPDATVRRRLQIGYANQLAEIDHLEERLLDAYIVDAFKVFNKKCLRQLLKGIIDAGLKEHFFPLWFVCFDFDKIKEMNTLCGGFEETDKVMNAGLDILFEVTRAHRHTTEHDVRSFPDMVFQVKSGDEFAIMLPRVHAVQDCRSIQARFDDALEAAPPIPIRTKKGCHLVRPAVTSSFCVMFNHRQNILEVLERGSQRVFKAKEEKKRFERKHGDSHHKPPNPINNPPPSSP